MTDRIEKIRATLTKSEPGPYGSYNGNAAEDIKFLLNLLDVPEYMVARYVEVLEELANGKLDLQQIANLARYELEGWEFA